MNTFTKLLLIIFLGLSTSFFSNAQKELILRFQIDEDMPSVGYEFNGKDLFLSWELENDNTVKGSLNGDQIKDLPFSKAGIYKVTVKGMIDSMHPTSDNIFVAIIEVVQWGESKFKSLRNALGNQSLAPLSLPAEAPDLSECTSLAYMFNFRGEFNEPIGNWDVSNVTDMQNMFNRTNFNQPLNNWDVSKVTNMSTMFQFCDNFNQPLNNWDVSNVTNMSTMFRHTAFNQPLNNWGISNVVTMEKMFASTPFNQSLNNWDVSNVTDMNHMFADNKVFNPK